MMTKTFVISEISSSFKIHCQRCWSQAKEIDPRLTKAGIQFQLPLMQRDKIIAAVGDLAFKYRLSLLEYRLVTEFVKSLTSRKYVVNMNEERYRYRSKWQKILNCNSEAYVSCLFTKLGQKKVITTTRCDGHKTWRALHPEFVTAIICQAHDYDLTELHKLHVALNIHPSEPCAEKDPVSNVDNSLSAVHSSEPQEYTPANSPVHSSEPQEYTPANSVLYIENPSSSIPCPKTPVLQSSSPSHPQVDNSRQDPQSNVTDLPAASLARRLVTHHRTSEPIEKVTKWFTTVIGCYGIDMAESYLAHTLRQTKSLSLQQHGKAAFLFFDAMDRSIYGGRAQ